MCVCVCVCVSGQSSIGEAGSERISGVSLATIHVDLQVDTDIDSINGFTRQNRRHVSVQNFSTLEK